MQIENVKLIINKSLINLLNLRSYATFADTLSHSEHFVNTPHIKTLRPTHFL